MNMETVTGKFSMIDADGIVRELEITVRREPGILIEVALPRYVDENGHFRDFVGQLVPRDANHRRVDISWNKERSAGNDERCSQSYETHVQVLRLYWIPSPEDALRV